VTKAALKKLWERDKGQCWHCGTDDDTVVPHHRANRGHGGSKVADRASNVILMCAIHNGLMESDVNVFREAKEFGWKISRHSVPYQEPIMRFDGRWFILGDMWQLWEIEHGSNTRPS